MMLALPSATAGSEKKENMSVKKSVQAADGGDVRRGCGRQDNAKTDPVGLSARRGIL